mmetsp:Transcript_8914/g.40495  ORF Transcript_8914/g.40495 Transcript_8914/m.40495 type:complete len:427 (+) Transcript_8914:67-1347(+)
MIVSGQGRGDALLDEGVRQRVCHRDALLRVKGEYLVQQVRELGHLASLSLAQVLIVRGEHRAELLDRLSVADEPPDRLARHRVVLDHAEHALVVVVVVPENRPPQQLPRHRALRLDELLHHLVVGPALERDLAHVQLVQAAPDAPEVHGVGVRQTQDDLGGPVEPGLKVRGDLVVAVEHGAAKVANLDDVVGPVDQDVIRLDIRVDHAAVLEVTQGDEHLGGEGPDAVHVEAHVAAVLFDHLPQVHVHGLEHHEHVVPELERSKEPDAVPLVLRVRVHQLLAHRDLELRRLVHGLVGADNLQGNLGVLAGADVLVLRLWVRIGVKRHDALEVLRLDHGREHAPPVALHHLVPPVENLAHPRSVVPLGVVPVIAQTRRHVRRAGLSRVRGPVHPRRRPFLGLVVEHVVGEHVRSVVQRRSLRRGGRH